MRYRRMGKTNLDVSVLGFGAMRLPMIGAKSGLAAFDPNVPIDEVEATKMVEYAIEQGINYFDTAYGYHGGKSETFLGKALKRHRSKILLATKLPVWNVQKTEDFDKLFEEQCTKLQTDRIDFYLIHGLGAGTWARMKELGILSFMDRLRSGGRIRFAGFSFHDELKVFKNIVDGYNWDMCMVQYNFYDQVYQAGRDGIAYAAARGLGLVVMEPLRGGRLVNKVPPAAQALWDSAGIKRSSVEWGLRWIWNHPEVSTALSGVSSLAQITENVKIANEAAANSLSAEELSLVDQVRMAYRKMIQVDCTGCGYCMPCPNGVNIPQNFALYNDTYLDEGSLDMSRFFYSQMLQPHERASGCFECLICEELCPQKIKISQAMKDVHNRLGQA
jgi:uncharacterized protein